MVPLTVLYTTNKGFVRHGGEMATTLIIPLDVANKSMLPEKKKKYLVRHSDVFQSIVRMVTHTVI